MRYSHPIRRSILPATLIVAAFAILAVWWRSPIYYGNWNKQTIYVGMIDMWYGCSTDSKAHAMWIDDDCGNGVYIVNRIGKETGINPIYAIIPEKTSQDVINSLIQWQREGAGIVLHGLRHEKWNTWDEQQVSNDINDSYTKLHTLGFDTSKVLKIIVPPHACNTRNIRKAIKQQGCQMITGACLVNPDQHVFQLGRIDITPKTDTTNIRVILQKAFQRNNFVIFGTHSSFPTSFSEEKTLKILNMAKEIGFDFDFNY